MKRRVRFCLCIFGISFAIVYVGVCVILGRRVRFESMCVPRVLRVSLCVRCKLALSCQTLHVLTARHCKMTTVASATDTIAVRAYTEKGEETFARSTQQANRLVFGIMPFAILSVGRCAFSLICDRVRCCLSCAIVPVCWCPLRLRLFVGVYFVCLLRRCVLLFCLCDRACVSVSFAILSVYVCWSSAA